MLHASVMDFGGQLEKYLTLMEFEYINSYHSSIEMAPFEAFYGRHYCSPIGLFEAFKDRSRGTSLYIEFESFRIDFKWLRVDKSAMRIVDFMP